MDVSQVTQIISAIVYTALAAAAVQAFVARRDRPSAWLAATFATLGLIVLAGLIVGEPEGAGPTSRQEWRAVYTDVVVIVLLAFPYLLHRFARSLSGQSGVMARLADIGMAGIVVWTLVAPPFPPTGAERPLWMSIYTTAALLWWAIMLGGVSVGMFRAGTGQPGVARRRMRLMSVAALLMNVALLAGTLDDGQAEPSAALLILTSVLGWLSAVAFWLGFNPPRGVRRSWRSHEEDRVRETIAHLTGARTKEAAADSILEPAARLLGGDAATVLDGRGAVLSTLGELPAAGDAHNVTRVSGKASTLVVARSRYSPMFGTEEAGLLRQLCAHLDLALDRLDAFQESERARREAERVNEELHQLVYGISHDMRNPLITVSGFLGLIQQQADRLDDQGKMLLERMQRSTQYMENLIDDLLQLSRVGRTAEEPEAVDMAALAAEIGEDVRSRFEDVHLTTAGSLPVWINPVRARQVMTNLIENAARHGGRRPLHVTVRPTGGDGVSDDGAWTTFEVADDGMGIPPEHRDRVFQIFQRLGGFDANAEGTGIGLTMVRRIVEDVDGTIELSDGNPGAVFRLSLPRPEAGLSPPAPRRAPRVAGVS